MRDSTTIFDQESDARADAEADLTKEFWGDGAGWVGTGRQSATRQSPARQSAFQLQSSDDSPSAFRLDHTPASMKAIRDGIAAFRPKRRWRDDSTGPVERTREHGIVHAGAATPGAAAAGPPASRPPRRPSPDRLAHRDATIADLAAGRYDGTPYPQSSPVDMTIDDAIDPRFDPETDDELIPLTPTDAPTGLLGSVDPMVVRITLVVIAVVLAIPLALALRDDAPTVETDTDPGAPVVDTVQTPDGAGADPATVQTPGAFDATTGVANTAAPATSTDAAAAPASAVTPESDGPPLDSESRTAPLTEADVGSEPPAAAMVAPSDDTDADDASGAAAATVTEEAERQVPDCSHAYTAGAGDSWYRIADEGGVTPVALLEQNRATLDTVIFPGGEICLPAGATMPSPPTTVAATIAPTTAAPTTAAPTTAAPSIAAPSTAAPSTAAPTTAAPAPQPSYTTAEVQALIRDTWPADQVDKALDIAWRESNYVATADNGWCCVGVFQLYWTVHRDWLDDHGIHTRDDLKDARKNIAAAYALYESSGGWGPWGG